MAASKLDLVKRATEHLIAAAEALRKAEGLLDRIDTTDIEDVSEAVGDMYESLRDSLIWDLNEVQSELEEAEGLVDLSPVED